MNVRTETQTEIQSSLIERVKDIVSMGKIYRLEDRSCVFSANIFFEASIVPFSPIADLFDRRSIRSSNVRRLTLVRNRDAATIVGVACGSRDTLFILQCISSVGG
jgi:hypothetical protein